MSDINIQMKQRNGVIWDNLFPVTKAENVEESPLRSFVSDSEKTEWSDKQDDLGFTPENVANKGEANGYAGLGSDGKILTSQLPAIAITDTFTASNETEMLALDIEIGDVCVRTDESKSYINVTGNNTSMSDWQELISPSAAVSSVNGEIGVVVLGASDVGAEPAFSKNSGFNLNKSDSVSSDLSTTLATSAAVKIANDNAVLAQSTAESKALISVSESEPMTPSSGDFWYEITA